MLSKKKKIPINPTNEYALINCEIVFHQLLCRSFTLFFTRYFIENKNQINLQKSEYAHFGK